MSGLGKTEAIRRLSHAVAVAHKMRNITHYSISALEFKKWRRDTEIAIRHIFGDEDHTEEFSRVRYSPIIFSDATDDVRDSTRRCYEDGLTSAMALLESMMSEIRDYWPNDRQAALPVDAQTKKDIDTGKLVSRQIFLVHGRDEGAKSAVARFLEKLDLQPVILDEQANRGLTIIEKFESHSDVGFAIVLLTPDDEGGLRGDEKSGRHRARQNVIFELGFFIGRLGRQRVCALTKGSAMEIPSDYSGVVYIPLDGDGAWRSRLVKELKAAGLDVDANRAL